MVLHVSRKTVSTQFMSSNPDNGQFYLDIKKTCDSYALTSKTVTASEFPYEG